MIIYDDGDWSETLRYAAIIVAIFCAVEAAIFRWVLR